MWTAPVSPAPSARSAPCWPSTGARPLTVRERACVPWREAQAEGVELWLDTTEDIDSCSRCFPEVGVLFDDGYLGLRRDYPGKAIIPPRKPNRSALPEFHERWMHHRYAHSVDRITVEHALGDHKRWKQLTRWTHRRENLPATSRAITRLASDCTANT